MTRRTNPRPFRTKPGEHGTLFRFRIVYRDRGDAGSPDFRWHCWAYDAEHALEKWNDTDDDGWRIVSGPERTRERAGGF